MELIRQRSKDGLDNLTKAKKNAKVAVKPREKRKLPRPFKSGGIIYFVHIPGTDGFVAWRIGQYKKMTAQIENLIQSGELNGQIYAFETHGSTAPPYVDIFEKVKERKVTTAKQLQSLLFGSKSSLGQ